MRLIYPTFLPITVLLTWFGSKLMVWVEKSILLTAKTIILREFSDDVEMTYFKENVKMYMYSWYESWNGSFRDKLAHIIMYLINFNLFACQEINNFEISKMAVKMAAKYMLFYISAYNLAREMKLTSIPRFFGSKISNILLRNQQEELFAW